MRRTLKPAGLPAAGVPPEENHRAVLPPSTRYDAPVTNDALSDARNIMVSAISSGLTTRLSGTVAAKPAFLSAVPAKRFSIAVSIGPGATMLMRTPDAAASLGKHHAHLMLHAEQRTQNVCVERRGVGFCSLFRHRARLALSSSAIDRNIQTAKARDGPIHQITHIIFVADVTTDKNGLCSERLQLRSQLLSFFISTTGHNNVCSVLRKRDCGSATDAGQCAC